MTTIERKDPVDAVMASRDEIDADLETELLAAIVDAEATAAGDGDAATRAIDAAVTAAIERGVGHHEETEAPAADIDAYNEDEEDEA